MGALVLERKQRNEFEELAPGAVEALLSMGRAITQSGLEPSLLELIKLRASIINGCAFCIQYHIANALRLGIPQDQLNLLSAWMDAPVYSERERAALRWTDLLTKLQSGEDVNDTEYSAIQHYFSDVELANLCAAIGLINAWNRIAKAYRFNPQLTAMPGRN